MSRNLLRHKIILRLTTLNYPISEMWYVIPIERTLCDILYHLSNTNLTLLLILILGNVGYKNQLTFVENNGVEPLTPCLQSRCSSQLS